MMKKKRKISAFIVFACLVILIIESYNEQPEFRIYNSFIQSYTTKDDSERRDTEINVIVYRNYNDENLYKRIESEHNRINGQPTELKINLYKWDSDIKKGYNPYKTIVIDYINDSVVAKLFNKNIFNGKSYYPDYYLCTIPSPLKQKFWEQM